MILIEQLRKLLTNIGFHSGLRFGWERALAGTVLLLCVASAMLCPRPALAAGIGQEFNSAYDAFHALTNDPARAKYRSEWEKVERGFNAVFTRDSRGDYAPKALYYAGRVYEEMGAISFVEADFLKAVDYFHRVVKRFPQHSWSDDCLYRSGVIRRDRLGDKAGAYTDFRAVLTDYAQGDMRDKARKAMEELDYASIRDRTEPVATSPAADDVAARDAGAVEPDAASAPPAAIPDGPASLDMIRYRSSDDYTRIVLELNQPVEYVYKFLEPLPEQDKGNRVYLDLRGAHVGTDVVRNVEISDGILRGYRVGQKDKDVTRVVLDLLDFQEHKVFHLNNPFRIIVDVYSPDKDSLAATAVAAKTPTALSRPPASTAIGKPPKKITGKAAKDAARQVKGVNAGDLVKVLGLTIKTVMIDAGHGAHDNGAAHNGLYEKDVNLKVALEAGALLKKQGFKVLYTRTDDTFVPLEERTAMANMAKADLFISLHCNAYKKTAIRGFETYSLSLKSSSDEARRVAARENGVQPHQISDLQFILADLVLNSKVEESSDLAEAIQRSAVDHVGEKYGIRNHGHRHAPFYVLMGAKMPAVLVEMGYLTNKNDAANLASAKYRRRIAEGIVQGVLEYKKSIEDFAMN
ncbi:MAG: N-acetylmuramoyl-L-alanine amidase [Desulfovibrio sp.]